MFETYKNKKVFITGHTGFKGGWLAIWLKKLGAEVCGYSLPPNTEPNLYEALNIENKIDKSIFGDILDFDLLNNSIKEFQPDIIFHLAAQPLVRLSYKEPLMTYKVNVIGTLNVLEAARQCSSTKAFVNITTDKCYENTETKKPYTEDSPMGGYDMYSSSKGCVEIMSSSFRRSFLDDKNSMALATVRAGNVIGGGDWSADRLIPDCIKSIEKDKAIEIRNLSSIRPWQFVAEPLSGYLLLGEKLLTEGKKYADGFNFGPNNKTFMTVGEVVQKVIEFYGKGAFKIQKNDNLHEAGVLMLDIKKAERVLGWIPTYTTEEAIKNTVEWYKNFYENKTDMFDFTIKQLEKYEENIKWNKNYDKK